MKKENKNDEEEIEKAKTKKLKRIMKKDYDDMTEEEISVIEDRIEELENLIDYFDRRDEVCCVCGGENDRYEAEDELERLRNKIY